MEDVLAYYSTIFFSVISETISVLGFNFSIAISMGFIGAVLFSLPATTASLSSMAILQKFVIYFFTLSAFGITALAFIDTQPSQAELSRQLMLDFIERNCGFPLGTFP
ncbi:hypothetical protein ACFLZ5_06475 [Thermodesulfobacteriota bacterium]